MKSNTVNAAKLRMLASAKKLFVAGASLLFSTPSLVLAQSMILTQAPDGPVTTAPIVRINLHQDQRSASNGAVHYTFDCTEISGRLPGSPQDPAARTTPTYRITSAITSGSFDVPAGTQRGSAADLQRFVGACRNCGEMQSALQNNGISARAFSASPARATDFGIRVNECSNSDSRINAVLGDNTSSAHREFCLNLRARTAAHASEFCLRAMTSACASGNTAFFSSSSIQYWRAELLRSRFLNFP